MRPAQGPRVLLLLAALSLLQIQAQALVIDVVRSPSLHIQNVTSATGKGQELIITALSVSLTTDKDFMDKPAAVYLPPNYDVRVLADKVKIIGNRGSLTLPGASLQIVARKLECDFPGCVIDLSGADAPTDATSKQANSGAQQGWPGAGSAGTDGVDGEDGRPGGVLSLALDSMSPNFRFVSRGGKGAPGQAGGNGGDGADGPSVADTTVYGSGFSESCEANNYSGRDKDRVYSYRSSSTTIHFFKGLPAKAGSSGGNAGKSGRNGNGGDAGAVSIYTLAPDAIFANFFGCAFDVSPGRGGFQTKRPAGGRKGAAGRPGCGGICYQSCPYYCNVDDDLSYNGDECCKDGRKNCVSSRGKEYATLGASASDGSPGAAGAIASAGVAGKEGEVGFSPGTTARAFPKLSTPAHMTMLLRGAQMQYLLASQGSQASGVETAKLVGMVKFLGALGCSAEDDPEGACGALAREVQALSAQINAGQNFYGKPKDWVPVANIKVIDTFVCNSLQTLKAMEAEYNKYFLENQAQQQRGAAVSDALNQFDEAIIAGREQLAAIDKSIDEAAANLKTLQQPRKDGLDAVLLTKDAFIKAIEEAKDKQFWTKLFEDIIGLATTVVTAVALRDPFTAFFAIEKGMEIYKSVKNEGVDPVTGLSTGAPSQTQLQTIRTLSEDTNAESFSTIWTDWKQAYNASSDKAKIVMSQKKMDDFMEPYLKLEAGEVYKYTMEAYLNVAKTFNNQLYALTTLYAQREVVVSQLASLEQQILSVKAGLAQKQNPNGVQYLNAMSGVYRNLQFMVIKALFELNQAVNYATLGQSPLVALGARQPTHAQLSTLYNQIQKSLLQSINDMENLQPWIENTPVLSAKKQDVPAATWTKVLRQGALTISMNPCDINRWGSRSQVVVSQVRVVMVGAKANKTSGAPPVVRVTLKHAGISYLFDKDLKKRTYTLRSRLANYEYSLKSPSKALSAEFDSQFSSGGGASCSSLTIPENANTYATMSPLASWRLTFRPEENAGVDFSAVTAIEIRFPKMFYRPTDFIAADSADFRATCPRLYATLPPLPRKSSPPPPPSPRPPPPLPTAVGSQLLQCGSSFSTSPEDRGPGAEVIYLDRHRIQCGAASALSSFKLVSDPDGFMHYEYSCLPIPGRAGPAIDLTTAAVGSAGTGSLLNQTVKCSPGSAITDFQLVRPSPTTIRYKYSCLPSLSLGNCTAQTTEPNDLYSNQIPYLDRHLVTCQPAEVLSSFELKSPKASKIQYKYTCCKLRPRANTVVKTL